MPFAIRVYRIRRVDPPSSQCERVCREDQGHVKGAVEILQEAFDFPPVIFVRGCDASGQERSGRLDVAPRASAQEKQLGDGVVEGSRLFLREWAGIRWIAYVEKMVGRRGSPKACDFLRKILHDRFNILRHVNNYLPLARVVEDHPEVVMNFTPVADHRYPVCRVQPLSETSDLLGVSVGHF